MLRQMSEEKEEAQADPGSDSESEPAPDEESEGESEPAPDEESEGESEPAPDEESEGESEPADDLPGAGTEHGEQLRQAAQAFDQGDYVRVRKLVTALMTSPDVSPDVLQAAEEYRRRLSIDPMQLMILAGCLIFFCWIVYTYVLT